MNARTWWDIAVLATVVAVSVVVTISERPYPGAQWGAIASLAAIGVLYFVMGRRLVATSLMSKPAYRLSTGITFQVLLLLFAGIGASFAPNMLITQGIVFPLLWMTSFGLRQAIIMNIVAAAAMGIGFAIALGGDQSAIGNALATQGMSTVFSIAIGCWIMRIAAWGSERQELLEELKAAQARLDAVSRDAGASIERERIARDIHDTIAQSLTSIVMVAQRAQIEAPAAEASLTLIEDTARDALGEARAVVAANAALPGHGMSVSGEGSSAPAMTLAGSLERLAARFTRETGVRVTSRIDDSRASGVALPRAIEVVLLRCAQEGLANVRKHATASAASVTIVRDDDGVTLDVTDNGRGLGGYTIDDAHGFGLTGMRERVGLVGGELSVTDARGGGARLGVRIPLQNADADALPVEGAADAAEFDILSSADARA